jgi:hypothetical protein
VAYSAYLSYFYVFRFEKTPLDLLCQTFKGTAEEKARVSAEIRKLLFSVSTPKKVKLSRQLNGSINSTQTIVTEYDENEVFFDAKEGENGGLFRDSK